MCEMWGFSIKCGALVLKCVCGGLMFLVLNVGGNVGRHFKIWGVLSKYFITVIK